MKKSYNEKLQQYHALVNTFKNQKFSDPILYNPYHIKDVKYNYEALNPWNLWHGNLDAEILLIGQDWGNLESFINYFNNNWEQDKINITDSNLRDLFSCIGYKDIGLPNPNDINSTLPLFFTNAVLGIKDGSMDLTIKEDWYKEMNVYLIALINIIQPKHIIAMGSVAYDFLSSAYNLPTFNNSKEAITNNGKHPLINGANVFRVAHCANKGRINRSKGEQEQDWLRINELTNNKYPNLKNLAL